MATRKNTKKGEVGTSPASLTPVPDSVPEVQPEAVPEVQPEAVPEVVPKDFETFLLSEFTLEQVLTDIVKISDQGQAHITTLRNLSANVARLIALFSREKPEELLIKYSEISMMVASWSGELHLIRATEKFLRMDLIAHLIVADPIGGKWKTYDDFGKNEESRAVTMEICGQKILPGHPYWAYRRIRRNFEETTKMGMNLVSIYEYVLMFKNTETRNA
jgi:hypothetical protein